MRIQKTWVGYIVWGLFSIVLFSNIGFSAVKLVESGASPYSNLITILMVFAINVFGAVLLIALYQLFMRYLYSKIFSEQQEASEEKSFIEIIIFGFCIFIAIFLRVIVMVAVGSELSGDDTYYRIGIGDLSMSVLNAESNGAILYSKLLKMLFGLFGEKFRAGLILQSLLQIASIIFTFFATRKAFGKVLSWIVFLCMCFLPGNFMAVGAINPALFFIFFLSLFFWILVLSVKEDYVQPSMQLIHCISFILLGVFSAFLTFFDISGLVTFVLGIVFLLSNGKGDEYNNSIEQKPFVRILLFVVSFVVGLAGMIFFVSQNEVIGFDAFFSYISQFIPSGMPDFNILTPSATLWDCMIPLFFGTVWFYSYIKNTNANAIPFVFCICIVFFFRLLKLDAFTYEPLYNYLWSVLTGLGICSLPSFVLESAELEKGRKERAARKELREQKRSMEAGEKSIQLDNISSKQKKSLASSVDGEGTQKSYGIGRKVSDSQDTLQTTEHEAQDENRNKKEEKIHTVTKVATVPVLPKDIIPVQNTVKTQAKVTTMNDNQTNTTTSVEKTKEESVVKKIEDNPIVQTTVVKHSAPMRRGYRTPSKSTFSPEELERIRQHTNGEFAYHSKEEMMQTSDKAKETVLRNNFINVIPDSRTSQPENVPSKETETAEVNTPSVSSPSEPSTPVSSASGSMSSEDKASTVKPVATADKPKLIRNPLPGPKPHVPRELNFDYELKESEMDYDIKDLSGKDYFDI